MSHYYKIPGAVTTGEIGRKLSVLRNRNFAAAKNDLLPDEHLYAGLYTGNSWDVVCVDDECEFNTFYAQYKAGFFTTFRLYALPEGFHNMSVQR